MNKATFAGFFVLGIAALPASAAVIDIGTQYLEPNEAGQTFQINISTATAETAGLMLLELQVGDGGPDPPINGTLGPTISNADVLTGTVFEALPNGGDEGWSAGNPLPFPQLWGSSVLTDYDLADPFDPGDPQPAPEAELNGLIATVTVDTIGFASGTWDLIASENAAEDRTEFYTVIVVPAVPQNKLEAVLVPLTVNDGFLKIVDEKLLTVADGSWGNEATWDLLPPATDTEVPYEGYKTEVRDNTVSVDAGGMTFSLTINNVGGKVTVESDQVLSTLREVNVAAGVLELAPRGVANVGEELAIGGGGILRIEFNGPDNGLAAASDVVLLAGSTLDLEATNTLGDVSNPAREWGDQTRTIVTGAVSGFFDNLPPDPDGHISRGVFLTDQGANGQTITYNPNSIDVDLFQAGPGDTDGNRKVEGPDILAILTASLFGDGLVLNPDGTYAAYWKTGDFDGNHKVEGPDILLLLQASLFGDGEYTNITKSAGAGGQGDAKLVISADGVVLDSNGATINGYVLTSDAGILTGDDANNLGLFQGDSDDMISGGFAMLVDGQHALGDVIGETDIDLASDLTLIYTIEGQVGLFTASVVVPEPATIAMLLGALALLPLAWRRRKLSR